MAKKDLLQRPHVLRAFAEGDFWLLSGAARNALAKRGLIVHYQPPRHKHYKPPPQWKLTESGEALAQAARDRCDGCLERLEVAMGEVIVPAYALLRRPWGSWKSKRHPDIAKQAEFALQRRLTRLAYEALTKDERIMLGWPELDAKEAE